MVEFNDIADDPCINPNAHIAHEGPNVSTQSEERAGGDRRLERSRYTQVKDSMWETLDSIVQSGATDQMRGYANEAMGKTKLTLGLATQSTHLTLTGLAQIAVGEFQKSIGEAKRAEDGKDILPGL